ncbi:AAA family ATPase [Vibrio parahaemolyticus]|nr:AAA family ATPase [Vibrio parahaemolyticus]
MDLFGLERESKIADSGIREIFTPHQPVQSEELFFGRQKAVSKIIEQLNTPGQHVLLYGDRGVGKSSLANITTKLLIEKVLKVPLFVKRCSSEDNFLTIFEEVLKSEGVEISLKTSTFGDDDTSKLGASIKVLKVDTTSKSNESHTYEHIALNPSSVAKILQNKNGLLYIDETDQLQDPKDKIHLAETIKLLSDGASPFKILVVGIAETGEELTAAHPSVGRCLKETRLNKMSKEELETLITEGSEKAGIHFEFPAVNAIVRLSSGYPHFTHLLALKCCEEVIDHKHEAVTLQVLQSAVREAVNDAEGTLKRIYDQAVRSSQTDMFKTALLAAARIGSQKEFQAPKWRQEIANITGNPITQGELNNYLNRLVSDDESCIIKRLGKGVYKFNDPRMPSFVKIASSDL